MPFSVNHDIAVMPVLDLQDVAHHGIGRHRLDEVQAGFLELDCILATVLCNEKVEQIVDLGTSHLVT